MLLSFHIPPLRPRPPHSIQPQYLWYSFDKSSMLLPWDLCTWWFPPSETLFPQISTWLTSHSFRSTPGSAYQTTSQPASLISAHTLSPPVLYFSGAQPFWHKGLVSWKTIFPWTGGEGRGGWFRDDSSALHLLCTLFLLLLHCNK